MGTVPEGPIGKTALVKITDEAAGDNCPASGKKVETGIDEDSSGTLEASEVKSTTYVCNGTIGPDGLLGLVVYETELAGTNCPTGGQKVLSGVDRNGNETLDADEVGSTAYVCNGDVGDTGETGPRGHTTLVVATAIPSGEICADGGTQLKTGPDKNGDGTLGEDEALSTTNLCNVKGDEGGTSLVSITAEQPGANCVAGGRKVQVGVDDSADGILGEAEVDSTFYVCDGLIGKDGAPSINNLVVMTAEPEGTNCEHGGTRVESGLDTNADGALAASEVLSTGFVCNGVSGADSPCAGNSAPVINEIVLDKTITKLAIGVHVFVDATDADGDTLDYVITGVGATITKGTDPGDFTLAMKMLNGPYVFSVTVSDGCQVAIGSFEIVRVDELTPPEFEDPQFIKPTAWTATGGASVKIGLPPPNVGIGSIPKESICTGALSQTFEIPEQTYQGLLKITADTNVCQGACVPSTVPALYANQTRISHWTAGTSTDTWVNQSVCLGEASYAGITTFEFRADKNKCTALRDMQVDNAYILPANDLECPATGRVLNGGFDSGLAGWKAAAGPGEVVLDQGNNVLHLEMQANCAGFDAVLGLVSVPLLTTVPHPAIQFRYRGTGDRALRMLMPDQTTWTEFQSSAVYKTARMCVPASFEGTVPWLSIRPNSTGSCTTTQTDYWLDDLVVVNDPTCQ